MKLGQRIAKLEAVSRSPFGKRNLVIVTFGEETDEEAMLRMGIDRIYPDDDVLFVHVERFADKEAA